MAKVQGVKEKLHFPLYDAFLVPAWDGVREFDDRSPGDTVLRGCSEQDQTGNQPAGGGCVAQLEYLRGTRFARGRLQPEVSCSSRRKELKSNLNESEILADLIYNSVTSLIVGEKIMIEAPTFWFPSGAGVSPGFPPSATGSLTQGLHLGLQSRASSSRSKTFEWKCCSRGTCRRVGSSERDDGPSRLGNVVGPLRIWVALDGYLTRDVH